MRWRSLIAAFALLTGCWAEEAAPRRAPPPAQLVLPELHLARIAVDLLADGGWAGEPGPLPLRAQELPRAEVRAILAEERRLAAQGVIPPAVAPLYTAPAAEISLRETLSVARREFVDFLRSQGVADAYLAELARVIPDASDRLRYDARDGAVTRLEPMVSADRADWGRLVLTIAPADVWVAAKRAGESGIAGPAPLDPAEREDWLVACRDAGLRFTAWHELTHALQRAYLHPNLPEIERASQAGWSLASQRLLDTDPATAFTRPTASGAAERLRRTVNERQAESVAFQAIASRYDLSGDAADRTWDVWFGQLTYAAEELELLRDDLSVLAPDRGLEDLAVPLGDVVAEWPDPEERSVLIGLAHRLARAPETLGLLHPMRPELTRTWWSALQRQPQGDPERSGRRRKDRARLRTGE
jgi:hypothetical protein